MGTVATERHWLAAACTPARHHGPAGSWTIRIVDVFGWSVATDAKLLVALQDGGAAAEPTPDGARPISPAARKTALNLIRTEPPKDAVPVEVGDLAEWCRWPLDRPCKVCGGTGWEWEGVRVADLPEGWPTRTGEGGRVEAACYECEGEPGGRDYEQNTLGWVAGGLIDRRVFRPFPAELRDGNALLWAEPFDCGRGEVVARVVLAGEASWLKWRAVVNGIARHADRGKLDWEHRTAPVYVPGVGRLWHLIENNTGRGVVADWLMDRGLDIETVHPLPF